MATRTRVTPAIWVDRLLNAKSAKKTGVVRRQLGSIPSHLKEIDIINEVTSRGYKAAVTERQIIVLTDRFIKIY
jgi:hypothetical protein